MSRSSADPLFGNQDPDEPVDPAGVAEVAAPPIAEADAGDPAGVDAVGTAAVDADRTADIGNAVGTGAAREATSADEDSTTGDAGVMALIQALQLPSIEHLPPIEPFESDNDHCPVPEASCVPPDIRERVSEGLMLGPHGKKVPVGIAESLWTRVDEAQTAGDLALSALGSLDALECRLAARKAALIERFQSARSAESNLLYTDAPRAQRQWAASLAEISAVAEVGALLRLPERTANALCSQAQSLIRKHRPTLAELEAGRLSWQHAVVVLENLWDLEGTAKVPPEAIESFEHALVDAPVTGSVSKFRSRCRHLREKSHPASIETRTKTARENRRMEMSPASDGMAWLNLYLGAETAQGIWNQSTRIARSCKGPEEARTLTQLRVDAAAALLLGQPGVSAASAGTRGDETSGSGPADEEAVDAGERLHRSGRESSQGRPATDTLTRVAGEAVVPRAQVLVTVPFLTLLGIGDESAELEGYGPVPASIARRLVANAPSFLRILTDPVNGEPLGLDPDRYRITESMRLVLRARDGTCTFTNCNTVTADTQLDHLLAREHGGTSTESNLADECVKHHLLKHAPDGKDRHGKRRRRPAHGPNDVAPETSVGYLSDPSPVSGPSGPSSTRSQAPSATPQGSAPPDRSSGAPAGIRGWKPSMTESNRAGWTSPSGRYYPPQPVDIQPPDYPDWLMARLTEQRLGNDRIVRQERADGNASHADTETDEAPPPF